MRQMMNPLLSDRQLLHRPLMPSLRMPLRLCALLVLLGRAFRNLSTWAIHLCLPSHPLLISLPREGWTADHRRRGLRLPLQMAVMVSTSPV